jgi:hypothetical protein
LGTAVLGMYFFLTLFIEDVWGYSPLRTGLAYLPYVPAILASTVIAQRAVTRIGARPLLVTGSAIAAGAMFWLSRISEHSTYGDGMLGPVLVAGAGLGLLVTPAFLVGLTGVRSGDTGVASSMVNVGQQVGGSIGLAVIGTVAWSAVASNLRSAAAAAARAGVRATGAHGAALRTQIYDHALATGFSRGFVVSAGALALAAVIALVLIRVGRQNPAAADPMAEPMAEPGPGSGSSRDDRNHHDQPTTIHPAGGEAQQWKDRGASRRGGT